MDNVQSEDKAKIAKVRVKFGEAEIEYEGDLATIGNDPLNFAKRAKEEFVKMGVIAKSPPPSLVPSSMPSASASADGLSAGKTPTVSAAYIVKKSGAKTNTDKILCVLAKLQLGEKEEGVSYQAIREAANTLGVLFPKKSRDNFRLFFKRLIENGHIRELGAGEYALSPSKAEKYERIISGDNKSA